MSLDKDKNFINVSKSLAYNVHLLGTKAQFKRRTFHVPNLIPIWVDPND